MQINENGQNCNVHNNCNELKITIACWNIRGIADKLYDPDLQLFLLQHDIIILHETMKREDYDIHIPGYTFFHYARKQMHPKAHRPSGGIGILISNTIKDNVEIFCRSEIVVWVRLKSNKYFHIDKDIYVGCVYLPPEGSTYMISAGCPFNILQAEIAMYQGYPMFLCGDFNSRTGRLQDYESDVTVSLPGCDQWSEPSLVTHRLKIRHNIDTHINRYGKNLAQLCRNTGLFIQNGRHVNTEGFTCYTALGKSVVDYLLTNTQGSHIFNNKI